MFRSLNIAATGMVAQETQLDTISNNLANANTVGYKAQNAQFEDLIYQNVRTAGPTDGGNMAPTSTQVGTGSRVVAIARSFSQGAMQQTGNPLDLAIEGNGFFTVMQLNGEPAYTRAGSLQLNAQGLITTSDGLPIQPQITVPADATSLTIGSDGTVTAVEPNQKAPVTLGQIQISTFPNPNGFADLGHNLFAATAASGQPVTGVPGVDGRGSILQGATEASNVEVVNEMVNLISAQRGYEINSKVVAAADEMLRDATQMQS